MLGPALAIQPCLQFAAAWVRQTRVQHHRTGRCWRRRSNDHRAFARHALQLRLGGTTEQVERQQQIDFAARGLIRTVEQAFAQPDIADHRARLLRQTGLIQAAHVEAVEHRCRANDLTDRHHTRAADARHAQREVVAQHEWDGIR